MGHGGTAMKKQKAVRIRHYIKNDKGDNEYTLTGLIPAEKATGELLEQYEKKYGRAHYVDFDEEY